MRGALDDVPPMRGALDEKPPILGALELVPALSVRRRWPVATMVSAASVMLAAPCVCSLAVAVTVSSSSWANSSSGWKAPLTSAALIGLAEMPTRFDPVPCVTRRP